jgi:NADH:ubiquinone oxidoreductase subunit 6 (subunit J)
MTDMMNTPEIYIAITILVLAIIAVFVIYTRKNKKQKQPSKLISLAISLVILGIVFGDDRLIGYSLIGAGVLLSIIDIIKISKTNK